MVHAVRRGGAGKAVVGALVGGVLVVVIIWGLLAPEPGLPLADHAQLLIEVNDTLDAFHEAAARADGEAYFAHFAPEGIFLGTDATERWTVEEFRPVFAKGPGWTYIPIPGERHVDLIEGDTIAVFDELLLNVKYGQCRGSGVLRNMGDQWLIVQYNLHFPVPNDLAEPITRMIQDAAANEAAPAEP